MTLLVLVSLFFLVSLASAQTSEVRTGEAALADWKVAAPGVRRYIKSSDLLPPKTARDPESSIASNAKVVEPPQGAARSRAVPLQQDIPETPPQEEVSTLGDEVLYFHQPDEDLRVEDIFPDVEMATPEELVAAKEEFLRCVNTALAGMPIQWRRAMRLRYAGGLTSEQLSEVLADDLPGVERVLEYAREHLRQTLMAAGCTFISKV